MEKSNVLSCFNCINVGQVWGSQLQFKSVYPALASVAQLIGHHPAKRNVAGSIPCQGTCLGSGCGPSLGCVQKVTNGCFSVTSMFLSLSFLSL